MLKQLHIQNFTLIDELDINFYPGFSVITGETGAGKSIILGAIGLLMGNRADTKLIRTGKEKCLIEAHFDVSNYNLLHFFKENDIDYDATDCILRREINSSGKSRHRLSKIYRRLVFIPVQSDYTVFVLSSLLFRVELSHQAYLSL